MSVTFKGVVQARGELYKDWKQVRSCYSGGKCKSCRPTHTSLRSVHYYAAPLWSPDNLHFYTDVIDFKGFSCTFGKHAYFLFIFRNKARTRKKHNGTFFQPGCIWSQHAANAANRFTGEGLHCHSWSVLLWGHQPTHHLLLRQVLPCPRRQHRTTRIYQV